MPTDKKVHVQLPEISHPQPPPSLTNQSEGWGSETAFLRAVSVWPLRRGNELAVVPYPPVEGGSVSLSEPGRGERGHCNSGSALRGAKHCDNPGWVRTTGPPGGRPNKPTATAAPQTHTEVCETLKA